MSMYKNVSYHIRCNKCHITIDILNHVILAKIQLMIKYNDYDWQKKLKQIKTNFKLHY